MNRSRCFFLVLYMFFAFGFGGGCARLVIPDQPEQQVAPAEVQLARLAEINTQIRPFKGIGELRVYSREGSFSFRGAWLGVPERRFRVETVGVAGQPGVRLICDGDACHFLYEENACFRKISSRRQNLSQLAGIDMDVADLVLLLGGGIPVVDHDAAWIENENDPGGPVIKLHRRFYGEVETIRFTGDMSRVREVAVYGFRNLKYRAEIVSTRLVNGRRIPDRLLVENEDAAMQLVVERVWYDTEYGPDAFIPRVPEERLCD